MADVLYLNQTHLKDDALRRHEAQLLALSDGIKHYERNQPIIVDHEKTQVIYVFQGALRVFIENAYGAEKLLYYVEAGNSCFASHDSYSQIVLRLEAAKSADVCLVDFVELMRLMVAQPETFERAMKTIEQQIIAIEENLLDMAACSLKGRICKFIQALAAQSTIADEEGNIVLKDFPKRQDIARFTGIHKTNVTKALGELERDGIIKKDNRRLLVRDLARLEAEIANSY